MKMAPSTTRGPEKKNKKKHKNKAIEREDNDKETNASELKTEGDEELLHNVEDQDGECDMDFDDDDGQDIDNSEISGFLDKIGISKHRPFSMDLKDTGSKKEKVSKEISDVDIKEEKAPKKEKKKKNKFKTEEVDAEKKKKGKEKQELYTGIKEEQKDSEKHKKKSLGKNNGRREEGEKPHLKALEATMSYLKLNKSRSFLLLKSGELWRDEKVQPESSIGPEDDLVKEAERLAKRLLEEDTARFAKNKENAKGSEARWVKTVLVSGTLSDKVAALTLLIRESPVHNVARLDSLLSMASKKGRREALIAVETLSDLFMTGLLPDRKLHHFYQFPLSSLLEMTSGNVDQRDKFLVCWYFEDVLKKKYTQFIKILGEMLFDTLQATKEAAVRTVYKLLTGKSEQDNVLLATLINKLGDKTLHNKSANLIGKLMENQPTMIGTIMKEICQLMYRPNVSHRAQYNAICLLTQVRLNTAEDKLPTELIKIYMSFFQIFLKKREIDSKTMSALLTGVNRAYPYAKGNKLELVGELNEVYKIIPTVNFQTSVQALMLLFHVTSEDPATASRFYCALYRKLNDPGIASASKQTLFLTLLFRSLKADDADNRVLAFIKRILQVYAHHPAHIICGVLIILSKVLITKPNLLSSALKSRIVSNESKDIKSKERKVNYDDDEEERFVDLPIPEEFRNTDMYEEDGKNDEVNGLANTKTANSDANSVHSSAQSTWIHRVHKKRELTYYDPKHRNPLYCRAELECIWELEELLNHFHPTVALYASLLLRGKAIIYQGDPLEDYTLIRFLDRFVYKNPKQPTVLTNIGAKAKREVKGIRLIPVNSEKYLKQKKIPEDEQFLFKYFSERVKQKAEKVDEEDVEDDEFDAYLDKFMGGKKEDFGDMGLDFAADTAKSKNKNKGKKGAAADSDSDDDDDDDEDDDDDMDFGDDELATEFERELQGMENQEDGFDEENVEFSPDEDDTLGSMMMKPGKKRKRDEFSSEVSPMKGKKRKEMDLFTSAEEFSTLLEEGVESGSVSLGGSNEMMNKDNSARKQIAWEEKRDSWIHNKDKRSFKGKKKGKQFSQRPAGNKAKHRPGNKKGKK